MQSYRTENYRKTCTWWGGYFRANKDHGNGGGYGAHYKGSNSTLYGVIRIVELGFGLCGAFVIAQLHRTLDDIRKIFGADHKRSDPLGQRTDQRNESRQNDSGNQSLHVAHLSAIIMLLFVLQGHHHHDN